MTNPERCYECLLMKTGIVKKWIDTLKGESFSKDTFDYFVGALTSILTPSLSAESLRSLALYITYAINKTQPKSSLAVKQAKIPDQQEPSSSNKSLLSGTTSSITTGPSPSQELSRLQIGLRILDLYSDLLCRVSDTTNIKKFARTVTNKV